MKSRKPEYLYDPLTDKALDAEIRQLLSLCFPDEAFTFQRFKYELPLHRWILRNDEHHLIAHAALHEKRLGFQQGELQVAGVAEVCVHPDYRGHQFVSLLLKSMHDWARVHHFPFSALFGNPKIYKSLGYRPVMNCLRIYDVPGRQWISRPFSHFLVLPLANLDWPEGILDLRGPSF